MPNEIFLISNKKQEKVLRRKTADFDFNQYTRKEITELIAKMRRIMREANGIGLSANQIGLDLKVFVAEIQDPEGGSKFYAVFNPKLEKASEEKTPFEEGCLSIPGKWGEVIRPDRVIVSGLDKNGRPVKVKAWGLLARIFQHELDHLSGKLFIDRTKKIYTSEKTINT